MQDLRKRPGVYLGKKTLDGVASLIGGYILCMYERDGVHPEFLTYFQDFVVKHYGIQEHAWQHWTDIIRFFNPTEEDAFDEFYMLVDEYEKRYHN